MASQCIRWWDDVTFAVPHDVYSARLFVVNDPTHFLRFGASGVLLAGATRPILFTKTALASRSGVTPSSRKSKQILSRTTGDILTTLWQ